MLSIYAKQQFFKLHIRNIEPWLDHYSFQSSIIRFNSAPLDGKEKEKETEKGKKNKNRAHINTWVSLRDVTHVITWIPW